MKLSEFEGISVSERTAQKWLSRYYSRDETLVDMFRVGRPSPYPRFSQNHHKTCQENVYRLRVSHEIIQSHVHNTDVKWKLSMCGFFMFCRKESISDHKKRVIAIDVSIKENLYLDQILTYDKNLGYGLQLGEKILQIDFWFHLIGRQTSSRKDNAMCLVL